MLVGSYISKGDRCSVRNVKFAGEMCSEDQETDGEFLKYSLSSLFMFVFANSPTC